MVGDEHIRTDTRIRKQNKKFIRDPYQKHPKILKDNHDMI